MEGALMQRMRRTHIYWPTELSAALDRLASRRGTSKAALIRLAAQRLIAQEQPDHDDPILGIIGLADAGSGRVSLEHDRVPAELSLRRNER
jgi:hypothetical protein